jgi:hypothetical protein
MAEPSDQFSAAGRRGMPRWAPWAIAAAVIGSIALIVVLIVTLSGRGDTSSSPGSPTVGSASGSGSADGTQAFSFQRRKIVPLRVSPLKTDVPDLAAPTDAIQRSLTNLYAQAVVNRANWTGGPPAAVWNAFAPEIRAKAQTDRAAFTIGQSGRLMSNLQISSSNLTIRYLIDSGGHIAGVQADVSIIGTGEVRGSGAVNVVVSGRLLMQQVNGSWLITGYPAASVTVKSPHTPAGGTP